MKTFLETLVFMYGQISPEFWSYLASLLGSFAGLILLPPSDWRSGIGQIFISYLVSHYASMGTAMAFPQWPLQAVRFGWGFVGYGFLKGVAKIVKQFENDPQGTFWETILKSVVKFREMFPKKDG